jgi:hypothetical protein
MKTSIRSLDTVAITVVGFVLSPKAAAISPPPDGGYPGANTAEGQGALFHLTTGSQNTAVGAFSLASNTGGFQNTAVGAYALLSNTAYGNRGTGSTALFSNTTGSYNTASGFNALPGNTSGSQNTAIGSGALFNQTGSNNAAVGGGAGRNVSTANNVICIGFGVAGANVDNSCYIGSIYGQPIDPATAAMVEIDSDRKLGTVNSSRRFKRDVQSMDRTSEAILALKPVTFHYKHDTKNTPCFGLIAEDVAEVSPELVVRDKNGEILSVRYDAVNAMVLNEFLKEHRRVEELKSAMAQQRKEFEAALAQQRKTTEAVVARLGEQEARIQAVSAQLEERKSSVPLLVENQ